ncbi:terminase, partial [Microbulbifer sp. OS29]|nr:terminase [Microbulbifer okhotskensis]
LFMCAFMEAGLSVFKLDDLLSCSIDTNVTWVDFKKREVRPYGNLPVWIGYDPSRSGDGAAVVVIAPPLKSGGKFRVLEKIVMRDRAWQWQANRIKELTEKY